MESLQLSQVLADLSNLGAAEPEAAAAIVSANAQPTNANTAAPRSDSNAPTSSATLQVPSQRPSALARSWSTDPSAPKVDKYGRRILINTPSSRSGSTGSSTPGTPRHDTSKADLDADLERASTIMALYDIRSKIKQQDNSSLIKAREKVTALAARQQAQQAQHAAREEQLRRNRYSFPRPTQ